jgi:hypothetical protein
VRACEVDRLRQCRPGFELERSERSHGEVGVTCVTAEDTGRERASKAVARTDEDDVERGPD